MSEAVCIRCGQPVDSAADPDGFNTVEYTCAFVCWDCRIEYGLAIIGEHEE